MRSGPRHVRELIRARSVVLSGRIIGDIAETILDLCQSPEIITYREEVKASNRTYANKYAKAHKSERKTYMREYWRAHHPAKARRLVREGVDFDREVREIRAMIRQRELWEIKDRRLVREGAHLVDRLDRAIGFPKGR